MGKEKREKLIQAALKGVSFDHLIDLVAEYLHNPIVVIDNSFNIIAYSKTHKSKDFIWLEAVKRGYITIDFGATLNNWDEVVAKDALYFDVDKISDKTRRFMRLEYDHRKVGYLNVLQEDTNLDTYDDEEYRFIADIITKELVFNFRYLKLDDGELKEEEIILELLQERFIDRLHFITRCKGSRLSVNGEYKIGAIDLKHYISYNAHRGIIKDNVSAIIPNCIMTFFDDVIVILINGDFEKMKLQRFLKDSNLYMGISDNFEDLYELMIYLSEAKASLRLKDIDLSDKHIILYNDVKFYHMYEHFPSEELLRYCDEKMIRLKSYDEQNKTEYIKTLAIYLTMQKSIQKTAEELYVHRNTINYRIQKIKEIIEVKDVDVTMLRSCEIIHFINKRNKIERYR